VRDSTLRRFEGRRILDIARDEAKDPFDVLFDLLVADHAGTGAALFAMSEADVRAAIAAPWVGVGSDFGAVAPDGPLHMRQVHPRAYGTFPRILRKYVREEKRLWLEETIGKMSALPAQRMRLTDRGVLKTGMWADVVVFNPEKITDRATFENPNQLSEGMDYVLVNGVPVIAAGKMTNALPGKVLRGPGYHPTN
jgi:dihydroorotase/N-acyl-D-amino-acid deacylase